MNCGSCKHCGFFQYGRKHGLGLCDYGSTVVSLRSSCNLYQQKVDYIENLPKDPRQGLSHAEREAMNNNQQFKLQL
jgi:hypothetical protein